MIIHGKDRGFALTIGATIEIAEFCPNGDISRIGDAISSGGYARQMANICKLIVALNRGYEERRAFTEAGYVPDPLTEKEVQSLTTADLTELQGEAMAAFARDSETTVETKPPKKDNAPPESARTARGGFSTGGDAE